MQADAFLTQTAPLRNLGGQRVWSLMISLFGDLAQDPGTAIDGPALSAIMTGLEVKPEATRVALHRLRNDGWITSKKSGRISRHSLTSKGRKESIAASPRIYATPGAASEGWQIVLTQQAEISAHDSMATRGFTAVLPHIFVGPSACSAPSSALAFAGDNVPDWLRAQAQPQSLLPGYDALLTVLRDLPDTFPHPKALSPVQTTTLRCLIVHNWRRLVLKHPALPGALIDPAGSPHQCHLRVHDMLHRFTRPGMDAIAQHRAAA